MKFFYIYLFSIILFFLSSCQNYGKTKKIEGANDNETSFFPVTDFLKGQIRELDSMPLTPLKTITSKKKTDSVWLKRGNIREFATPFLTPVFDSANMSSYYTSKSFLDQTINSFTLTYDANKNLPDNIFLQHVNVYIDPQTNTVDRIYLEKEKMEGDTNVIIQLTWKTNEFCSIRTIKQAPGADPEIAEEKMIWNFDK